MDNFLFKKHLEEDEHIRLIVHKHWLLGIRSLFFPVTAFVCCWALFSVSSTKAGLIISALLSTGSLVWLLRNFFDYYLDAWIITDHGIIDLEWLGWFHRQSSRIVYSDIQGVSTEVHGILGTVLRYGMIEVEKISTGSAVSIENVPRPRRVESVILQNMEAYLHSKNLKNAKHIEELLSKFVAQHIQEDSVTKDKKPVRQEPVATKPAPAPARVTKKSFTSARIDSSAD